MADKPFKDGPAYITDLSDDLYVPSAATLIADIKHIHLVNTSGSAVTVSLYVGATGAEAGGTEILGAKSIAANDVYDLYFPAGRPLTSADFLVGDASTTNVVTATITGTLRAA